MIIYVRFNGESIADVIGFDKGGYMVGARDDLWSELVDIFLGFITERMSTLNAISHHEFLSAVNAHQSHGTFQCTAQ